MAECGVIECHNEGTMELRGISFQLSDGSWVDPKSTICEDCYKRLTHHKGPLAVASNPVQVHAEELRRRRKPKPRITAPVMRGLKDLAELWVGDLADSDDTPPDVQRAIEWIERMEPHVKPSNEPPNFKFKEEQP